MCTHYYNAILDDSLSVVADNFLYPHQLPTKVCKSTLSCMLDRLQLHFSLRLSVHDLGTP